MRGGLALTGPEPQRHASSKSESRNTTAMEEFDMATKKATAAPAKKAGVKTVTLKDIAKKAPAKATAARAAAGATDLEKAKQKLDRKWEKYERKVDKTLDKTIKKNTRKLEKLTST